MGDFFEHMKARTNRENIEKRDKERRLNIIYLVRSFLLQSCFLKSAECLEKEANLSNQIQVCDNIDLDTILQEYCSYYFTKFNKQPSICKKVEVTPKKNITRKKPVKQESLSSNEEVNKRSKVNAPTEQIEDFAISIRQMSNTKPLDVDQEFSQFVEQFEVTAENKDFLSLIKSLVLDNTKYKYIKWSDCIGMENIIQLLNEAVVYPKLFPNFFKQIDSWKSILLFGPPGTGKTFIAKALASETSTTVINFSASSFISKFRGDSEKMIKTLFDYTRCTPDPAVIFIDELDAFCSKRDENQHEASRRFKSELLVQMDGMIPQNAFILATTNLPWLIDPAILRRFDKRIMVTIPKENDRLKAFETYLKTRETSVENAFNIYAKKTENFSYSDIKLVCKNAHYNALRRQMQNSAFDCKAHVKTIPLKHEDVLKAIESTRPTNIDVQKYSNWADNLGCV